MLDSQEGVLEQAKNYQVLQKTVDKCIRKLNKVGLDPMESGGVQTLAVKVAIIRMGVRRLKLGSSFQKEIQDAFDSVKPVRVLNMAGNWEVKMKDGCLAKVPIKNPTYVNIYADNSVEMIDEDVISGKTRHFSVNVRDSFAEMLAEDDGFDEFDGILVRKDDVVGREAGIYCLLPERAKKATPQERLNAIRHYAYCVAAFPNPSDQEVALAIQKDPLAAVGFFTRILQSAWLGTEQVLSLIAHGIPSESEMVKQTLFGIEHFHKKLAKQLAESITLFAGLNCPNTADDWKRVADGVRAYLKQNISAVKYPQLVKSL